jgi:glucosamine-6-phosphate deaminase
MSKINIAQEHPESYYDYMKKNVINHIKQQPAKWVIPDGMAEDPQKEADRMGQEIYENGGIDFQIMGIGINGHICFIEPNSKIPSTCYVTPIAEVNREFYAKDYGNIEDVPTEAITFGLGTVLKSKELLLMAVGEGKADIMKQALLEPITTELPATIMQMHNNAHVVLDTAAASKLPEDLAERAGNLFQITRYN